MMIANRKVKPMETNVHWKKRGAGRKPSSTETEYKISHKPVMLAETIAGLNIQPSGYYIDATLGRAWSRPSYCESFKRIRSIISHR